MIDVNLIQSKDYDILEAYESTIGSLNAGNKLGDVYLVAVSVVEKDAPNMVSYLTKSVETRIGIEFCESGLKINAKKGQIAKEGMILNVSIGFQNFNVRIISLRKRSYLSCLLTQ